ncbi:SRPBCC family protein [Duganella radicis]|uniref:Vanillate O-demethylase oxidoreductase VanB n=1 Tax=Duganella radicis TaxID=551988 RepID=A0A6L6PI42_9BURK|nr:SRPBCC family protein [Duganella radicis]MTV38642.1 vanillate O-demethylase oxidoreductase VanB [Duganella radicis]
MSTDQIERSIVIKAPAERVWRALSTPQAFGAWFGVQLEGEPFTPGHHARGPITISGFEHVIFNAWIERVEAPSLLSYRWHPYAIDPHVDYSGEECTLVTFTLQPSDDGGTLLTVVESGFDKVPAHRRVDAFHMNSKGWEAQLQNIARYVVQ